MNENENLVTEQVAENTENTAEQTAEKKYTEAEFNAKLDEVIGKKIARREAKIRKEYERKYGDLESVLRDGTGKEDVDEITDTFRKFYESKGVKINKKPEYSAKDIEALARTDADEIIRGGDEDVADEFDRLEALGTKMTKREQETFRILAEHMQNAETNRELAKLGVTEDVYGSKEFKDFSKKFAKDTPIAEIYQIYAQTQPKKEIKPMGSMKNSNSADNGVKEFYTIDEARKFTQKDFEKNPKLFEQVVKSSHQWNNR